jgi:L-lactate dehydrogenase complex protein LldG
VITSADHPLVERFAYEAGLAGATVHGPVAPAEAIALVKSIVEASGGRRVMAWAADELGIADAWTSLQQMGCEIVPSDLPESRAGRLETLARLDDVVVGVTSALGALADTGTLVMASGSGRPRLAWLLPPHHVALVNINVVVADMAAFFADPLRVAPNQVAHLAFVTGPSRTGDIELTLTRGVHGPKVVHVVLVQS